MNKSSITNDLAHEIKDSLCYNSTKRVSSATVSYIKRGRTYKDE